MSLGLAHCSWVIEGIAMGRIKYRLSFIENASFYFSMIVIPYHQVMLITRLQEDNLNADKSIFKVTP